MRIGFDAKRYFNNQSGLGNYSRGIINNLAVLFPQNDYLLFHKSRVLQSLPEHTQLISPNAKKPLWRQLGIASEASKKGVEVFHGLSNEIPIGLKKKGIKSIVSIHDVIFKKFPSHYPFTDRLIYDYKTGYALKNADKIIAISESVKEDLIRFYKTPENKIEVVYQFLEPQFYAPPVQNPRLVDAPYFIYISSFQHRKNHATLLDAFQKIKQQTDHHLVLAGMHGDTLPSLKRMAEEYQLTTRVNFFVDVTAEVKTQLLQHAEGFIYPSLDEGFGIPLAEAAMLNVPLAVSNIPVFNELAGNAALYFHPNKSNEIASVMLELALPESRKRFFENRHIITQKVDKQKLGNDLMRVYKEG